MQKVILLTRISTLTIIWRNITSTKRSCRSVLDWPSDLNTATHFDFDAIINHGECHAWCEKFSRTARGHGRAGSPIRLVRLNSQGPSPDRGSDRPVQRKFTKYN